MRKLILLFTIFISLSSFSQERLLTKKIVYKINVTDNKVRQLAQKDSIEYNYIVNKRFFWEAMDGLISDLKSKKLYLRTFNKDSVVWDSMINNLTKQLNAIDLKKYSKKDIEKVLENEIRSIKFMEEWTYLPETMMINKKIIAYCPVIERDSVTLVDEELKAVTSFAFDLGWIWQNDVKPSNDTLLLARNLQYTMPIYNPTPYRWWESNLEAEYSIPFFDALIEKADSRQILCYESPDAVEPFSKSELDKRKKHSQTVSIIQNIGEDNEIETDTIITLTYNSDDIDHLRFGEQILYDKKSHNFIKSVNYYSPIIRIFTSNNIFIGFYPLYYIRKQ
ncbi:MAG: hypothetical protein IJ759_07480 [Bacteroidales bacterium]|nr:hypothetical protein [Bacteroidales bacterium]